MHLLQYFYAGYLNYNFTWVKKKNRNESNLTW